MDGANEFQVFRRIILPMVSLPISVLAVTLTVNVVKLFDLHLRHDPAAGPGTSSRVIAFTMYQESFPGGLFGKGAAVAVVMLLILTPDDDLQHPPLPHGVGHVSMTRRPRRPAIGRAPRTA